MNELIDVIISNAIAFGIELTVLIVAVQLLMYIALRMSSRLLRWSRASEQFSEDWRRRVQRTSRLLVATFALLFLIGHSLLCVTRVRALAVAEQYVLGMGRSELIVIGVAVLKTLGVTVGAYLLARVLLAIVTPIESRLLQTPAIESRRAHIDELLRRLQSLIRVACAAAAVIIGSRLINLPALPQTFLSGLAYVGLGYYAARVFACAGDLAVDIGFTFSERLTSREGPLHYIGGLAHLAPLTKRTVEYFIYVSIATWVSDQLSPTMWPSRAGRIAIRIIAIFFISRVLVELFTLFIHEFFVKEAKGLTPGEHQQRRTLAPIFTSLLRYAIYFASLIMMLREAGIDPAPLLAGAGIAGVAIGLGAQAFVRDIVAGFFILFENLFLVGDFIECAGVRGHVEEIGVRMSKIRDSSGILHAIPNGDIRTVSSHSKAWVTAVVDLRVATTADLEKVKILLRDAVAAARTHEPRVLGAVKTKVLKIEPGALILRTKTPVTLGADNELGDMLREHMVKALMQASLPAPDTMQVTLAGPLSPAPLPEPAERRPTL